MERSATSSIRVMVIGRFTAIHTLRFCEELQRQGIEVAALYIGQAKWRPNVRVYHAEKNMRLFGIPRTATLGCLLYLRRAIQDFRPDIIHVQDDPRISRWLDFICPSNVLRAYTNWGHNSKIATALSYQRSLAATDLVTSDAPDVLEEIARFAPHARREIVRFAADPELFSPGQANPAILAQYGLNPKGLYIISPRSIRPVYNQLTLIRALPPVVKMFPDLQIILKHHHVDNYNDSKDYENQIRDEAKRLNIWDRIVRLDHLPYAHLCHLFRLCRAAVSIPLEDAFPATIFEAMACGCPLIVSNDRSYDGVVVNGVNSIVIEPTDTTALTSALTRFLTDPVFADRIRREALTTASEKGDFKKEILQLIDTYRSLVRTGKQRILRTGMA
jgi:glycosyltransferase involved in cell wall biosynthesis